MFGYKILERRGWGESCIKGQVFILQERRVVISLGLDRAWLEGGVPSFPRPRWREPERSVTIVWTTFKPSNAHTSASSVRRVQDPDGLKIMCGSGRLASYRTVCSFGWAILHLVRPSRVLVSVPVCRCKCMTREPYDWSSR